MKGAEVKEPTKAAKALQDNEFETLEDLLEVSPQRLLQSITLCGINVRCANKIVTYCESITSAADYEYPERPTLSKMKSDRSIRDSFGECVDETSFDMEIPAAFSFFAFPDHHSSHTAGVVCDALKQKGYRIVETLEECEAAIFLLDASSVKDKEAKKRHGRAMELHKTIIFVAICEGGEAEDSRPSDAWWNDGATDMIDFVSDVSTQRGKRMLQMIIDRAFLPSPLSAEDVGRLRWPSRERTNSENSLKSSAGSSYSNRENFSGTWDRTWDSHESNSSLSSSVSETPNSRSLQESLNQSWKKLSLSEESPRFGASHEIPLEGGQKVLLKEYMRLSFGEMGEPSDLQLQVIALSIFQRQMLFKENVPAAELKSLIKKVMVMKGLKQIRGGSWDFFISYTQCSPDGKHAANKVHTSLKEKGFKCWQDVEMNDMSSAAMEVGVQNSKCFLAVVTGPAVDTRKDREGGPPERNAYFSRDFCQKELRWAMEKNVPIIPLILLKDKTRIAEFVNEAPPDLQEIINLDFKELIDTHKKFWDTSINLILEEFQRRTNVDVSLERAASNSAVTRAAADDQNAGTRVEPTKVMRAIFERAGRFC